jgi:hypothetical protein
MTQQDLRIYLVNTVTFGFTFTNMENTLKIILLLFSIIYTIINIYKLLNKKEDANK